ncbi:hypothetical protein CAPTEDRAFT_204203 [Capitella teleta]|uniref:L1 transposable element RRM domain-containing protein n=1 Tax=Capitella teleta TaxID=283909 RepID=R7UJE3_CAPTE|nr:hypothetical protein CAPTEDRAFT_204203 [Capitella teleta]|eukprot:ELU06330.1 hypothetical protein CAPTEDRAFT_204203 [Capitella teleta]
MDSCLKLWDNILERFDSLSKRLDSLSKQTNSESEELLKILKLLDPVKYGPSTQEDQSQLILGNIEETGDDADFMTNLCTKMGCDVIPIKVQRIGRKLANRKRLLKVSFPSQFDAYAFKSKYTQMKKQDADIPFIRVRTNRSKEEQLQFKKAIKLAKKLNGEAKKAKVTCSYSVSDNGEIWKYAPNSKGKWRRVNDWVAPEVNNKSSGFK